MPLSISDLVKIPVIMRFDFDRNAEFVVYSSNKTGLPQLYLLSTKPGSRPKQITHGQDLVIDMSLSPCGDKVAYCQDKDGNEIYHLFVATLKNGESQRISQEPHKTFGVDWHPNGKEVTRAFASSVSCGLETFNLTSGESFKLIEPSPPILDLKYSHNGKWIACTTIASYSKQQILVLNRDDPRDTITCSVDENSNDTGPSWSADDKNLAFQTDAKGKRQIAIQEFEGEGTTFLKLDADEEASEYNPPVWHPNGRKIYYIVSKYGRRAVYGHPLEGKRGPPLPFPEGSVETVKVSRDGKTIAVLWSSMTSPPSIYICKKESLTTALLAPEHHKTDLAQLARVQSVWYRSFDEQKIHGWYIPSTSGDPPHAAVVWVHGGPWSQVSDGWYHGVMLHCLSQNGLAVFAPNYRGSTGYGKEFQGLSIGDPGGGDLEDIVQAAEWVKKQESIDSSRVAIIGRSYGGWMTLMALTKKPKVFTAGVAIVPAVNSLEMYEILDPLSRKEIEKIFGGTPAERGELYRDRSPFEHLPDIQAPLMIIAGEKDSRCLLDPIVRFVGKLKEMNHPHRFVLNKRAGHFSSSTKWKENIKELGAITRYLRKTLALT